MSNTAILTVAYLKNEAHKNMAIKSYESMPELYRVCVVNANETKLELEKYNNEIIQNSVNCFSMALNIGMECLFDNDSYDYILVSNLDVNLSSDTVDKLIEIAELNPRAGIVSARYITSFLNTTIYSEDVMSVQHGDGSFSCFLISRKAYETVGYFDENFRPAYFEDNDYLERLWSKGFTPLMALNATFFHVVQGTVKNDVENAKQYPTYMQKNLEYFRKKHGKTPEHLPEDIRFV